MHVYAHPQSKSAAILMQLLARSVPVYACLDIFDILIHGTCFSWEQEKILKRLCTQQYTKHLANASQLTSLHGAVWDATTILCCHETDLSQYASVVLSIWFLLEKCTLLETWIPYEIRKEDFGPWHLSQVSQISWELPAPPAAFTPWLLPWSKNS